MQPGLLPCATDPSIYCQPGPVLGYRIPWGYSDEVDGGGGRGGEEETNNKVVNKICQIGFSAQVRINQGDMLEVESYLILSGQVITEVVKFKLTLQ